MSKFFDNWAWAYRNAQAWQAVILLGGLLAWSLLETDAVRVEHFEVTGVLLELRGTDDNTQKALLVGQVRLPDGKEVKLIFPRRQPFPKAGDQIPLNYERYDNGAVYYFLKSQY